LSHPSIDWPCPSVRPGSADGFEVRVTDEFAGSAERFGVRVTDEFAASPMRLPDIG
jgi:hypothetical protein